MDLEFHPGVQRDVNDITAYYEKEAAQRWRIAFSPSCRSNHTPVHHKLSFCHRTAGDPPAADAEGGSPSVQ